MLEGEILTMFVKMIKCIPVNADERSSYLTDQSLQYHQQTL